MNINKLLQRFYKTRDVYYSRRERVYNIIFDIAHKIDAFNGYKRKRYYNRFDILEGKNGKYVYCSWEDRECEGDINFPFSLLESPDALPEYLNELTRKATEAQVKTKEREIESLRKKLAELEGK